MNNRVNKKRKFVTDGVFYAELNEFLLRKIAQFGYSGVEVRRTPTKTEIVIRATEPTKVIGENGKGIQELQSLITKRFNFPEKSVELWLDRVLVKGLDAQTQAQSIHYKLMNGLAVRRACYSAIKYIKDAGAQGCEVIISGKLRGQRAQSMKFSDGYMVKSGEATNRYVDLAIRHAKMRQGILGIKVKIMKKYDPKGKVGPDTPLADTVIIYDPREERKDRGFRRYEKGENSGRPNERGEGNRERGRGGFNRDGFNRDGGERRGRGGYHREGGFNREGGEGREGGDRPEGGFNREGGERRGRGGYHREGGYNRDGGENREGGDRPEGGERGRGGYHREGGYNRDGGERRGRGGYHREGGYNRDGGENREGGYHREGGENREGGYNREGGERRGRGGRGRGGFRGGYGNRNYDRNGGEQQPHGENHAGNNDDVVVIE